jgi:hypothetical protein
MQNTVKYFCDKSRTYQHNCFFISLKTPYFYVYFNMTFITFIYMSVHYCKTDW